MMRKFLLIVPVIFLSCEGPYPKDVLPPEKLKDVLFDITRADELVDLSSITDSTYRGNQKRYALYDSVFRIHGVSKRQYERSREWYQSRPDLLKPLLESVRDRTDTSKKPKLPPATKPV